MLETTKIDSFCLAVDTTYCDLKNQDNYIHTIKNKGTKELIKEKHNGFIDSVHGVTSSFYLTNNLATKAEELIISINAKQLGKAYLTGINSENINTIYEYLTGLYPDFYVPKDVFLQGKVRDIDLCMDNDICEVCDFHLYAKELRKVAQHIGLNSNNYSAYYNQYTDPTTGGNRYTGFQFMQRKNQTKDYPHTKFYHKGYELFHKSKTFAHMFGHASHHRIVRTETNIKTALVAKSFGSNVLENLLKSDLSRAMANNLSKYTGGLNLKQVKRRPKGLRPNEIETYNLIEVYIMEGKTLQNYKDDATRGLPRRTKYNRLKKIDEIYRMYLNKKIDFSTPNVEKILMLENQLVGV